MIKWIAFIFNKFLRIFKEFISIALPIAKQIIMAQLKDFAIATVSKLEKTDLGNEDRRKAAFNEISLEARQKGIEIGTSLIYMLIETSLQYIKEKNR